MATPRRLLSLCLLTLCVSAAAHGEDWPQWRGIHRDAKSPETGLLKTWPDGGPKLERTLEGFGTGFSSPIIVGDRICITGKTGDELHVSCLGADGTKHWKVLHGRARGEARSSPTVDGKALYVLSDRGRLAAFATDSGNELWAVDIVETFGGRNPKYTYSESVLIVGDRLFVQPGGPDAAIVALDKKTGKTLWKATGMDDTVTYCSPVLHEIHGIRQIVVVTEVGVVGVAEDTGKLLWRFDNPYDGARNCLTPIVWENFVFAESGHRGASSIVRIDKGGDAFKATPVWESGSLGSHVGGYVGIDGYAYGHSGRDWVCRQLDTGKEMFALDGTGNCSTIWADGLFYCFSNVGKMSLVSATPQGGKILSAFEIPNAGPKAWARLAIAKGRLYVRREDKLFVYGIRAK
ncbi:PQQ-binding-like beta-propeller repeat protein [bacterium]|nr:PQQ-binding-like beta-propeller repeat protein [bacterium]